MLCWDSADVFLSQSFTFDYRSLWKSTVAFSCSGFGPTWPRDFAPKPTFARVDFLLICFLDKLLHLPFWRIIIFWLFTKSKSKSHFFCQNSTFWHWKTLIWMKLSLDCPQNNAPIWFQVSLFFLKLNECFSYSTAKHVLKKLGTS